MAVLDGCEKAIRGLVEPGGLIELFVDVAVKGFAGSTVELLKAFFDGLFGSLAAVARPLLAAFLEKVGGRGAVDQFSQKLLEFTQRARSAAQCLDQYDDVWREVAKQVVVDVDTLKRVVRQLSGKSVEEIRRRVEELAKSLEEVERQIRAISISPGPVYFYAREWLAVKKEGDKLKLCNVFMGDCGRDVYVEYVPTPLEEAVVEEVRKRAAEGGGLVVVRGAKGIGKSTAVQVALYRLLQLPLKVGDQYYKPVVVAVRDYSKDEAEKFIRVAKEELNILPIFYLDSSKPRAYPKEPAGPYQPEMSIGELHSILGKLRDVTGAVAVVVLSNDQYLAVNELVSKAEVIDADQLLTSEKEKYIEALVKNYSSCADELVERVATAVASFDDNYAVAAVLAADWLKRRGCSGEEVEKAIKRASGDVHRFVLDYLWYGLFKGSVATANQYAPLLLAVGFFGPHSPKFAEAVVRAFGGRPEHTIVLWFSQPLHGTLYETIRKIAHGAVYRRFRVGSDDLCRGSAEESCRLVGICSEYLPETHHKRYDGIIDIVAEYAKFILDKFKSTTYPARQRLIDLLIGDFSRVYNGVFEQGLLRIKYKGKGPQGTKIIEYVLDELDILATLCGIAISSFWSQELDPLKEWFLAGDKNAEAVRMYLALLLADRLADRGEELVKRIITIADEVAKKKWEFYTNIDIWRILCIASFGEWHKATEEELVKALELTAKMLNVFATIMPFIAPRFILLLYEALERVKSGKASVQVTDRLALVIHTITRGPPFLQFFLFEILRSTVVPDIFNALYNAASNVGKFLLLETLLEATNKEIEGVNSAAVLLGKLELGSLEALDEGLRRAEAFISSLQGVEKAFVASNLYSAIATRFSAFGKLAEADEYAQRALEAVRVLENEKGEVERALKPYLKLLYWKEPDIEEALKIVRLQVYHDVARVYKAIGKLKKSIAYATKACKLAKEVGNVYYKIVSCSLALRLKTIAGCAPPIGGFRSIWRMASKYMMALGATTVATRLGEYAIALVYANRFRDVEKILKRWGVSLFLDFAAASLTYSVLALFDNSHFDMAIRLLPSHIRFCLPKMVKKLPSETGLASDVLQIVEAVKDECHGEVEVSRNVTSLDLLLLALMGLAYCERSEEWGLKLAKATAWAGSQLFKGVLGRLFGELYEALERVTVGDCITEEVLKAVYKLYYFHV